MWKLTDQVRKLTNQVKEVDGSSEEVDRSSEEVDRSFIIDSLYLLIQEDGVDGLKEFVYLFPKATNHR